MSHKLSSRKLKIVVLISGNGTNLQAIIDNIQSGTLPVHICAVLSDQADAYGLKRAQKAHITTEVISPKKYASRTAYHQSLLASLKKYQPDLIVLSGFMHILGNLVIKAFAGQIINIHPSLLPKYKGLNTYQKALAAGDPRHGTTIHFVTEDLDSGPIIAQKSIEIRPDDTVETLKQRTQALEHRLYPEVIAWFADNKVKLTKVGVEISD